MHTWELCLHLVEVFLLSVSVALEVNKIRRGGF